MRAGLAGAVALALVACSSQPPAPDWQVEAHGALLRHVSAALRGDARVEQAEFDRARAALAATGRAEQVARAELTRCAAQLARVQIEPCTGFAPLRADARPAERAYADWLDGRIAPADAPLLPPHYRALARPGNSAEVDLAALRAIGDPVSRLIAAGVLLRSGRASPAVLELAASTASDQGWRRALLAWLGVQLARAEHARDAQAIERLRRRISLAQGG